MFETLIARQTAQPADVQATAGTSRHPAHYTGPERRAAALGACLHSMLDEIDYGMLLVSADAQVLHLNHAARLELDGEHPLQMLGRALRAQRPQDVAPLYDALAAAQRGLRRLLMLGSGEQRLCVSVVPLPGMLSGGNGLRQDDAEALVLLVLGKRQVCAQLSVQGFARSLHLTPAETRVLEQLCAGVRPTHIAQTQQVAVSTVRTQIGSIRSKTGASSISALVRQVAVLPPLVGALRGGAALACR
ncbi:MAG: helix-turn-helix transcriptional regulator [Rubrivivax sp.]|nr:helix-turn-helix transcriptional regulator [Rubrivivax sp.]MDP3222708.1 helix-turn-helix transcriptional regulator [Rubrivivax sp.]MDP3613218.1 helix-turn-helix transcriptional regulator [Rubrivivax sp.]